LYEDEFRFVHQFFQCCRNVGKHRWLACKITRMGANFNHRLPKQSQDHKYHEAWNRYLDQI